MRCLRQSKGSSSAWCPFRSSIRSQIKDVLKTWLKKEKLSTMKELFSTTSRSLPRKLQEMSSSQLRMVTLPFPIVWVPWSWMQPNRTRHSNLARSSRFPNLSRTSMFTKTRYSLVIQIYTLQPDTTFKRFLTRKSRHHSSLKMVGSFLGASKRPWKSRSTSTLIRNTLLTADTTLRRAEAPGSCPQSGWGKIHSCLVRYFASRKTSLSSLTLT